VVNAEDMAARMFVVFGARTSPVPVAASRGRGLYATAKRALDVSIALTVLVALAPALLLVALAIRLESDGGIFYRARRLGRHGQRFTMYKFRTMQADPDTCATSAARPDARIVRTGAYLKPATDPRITPLGRWLRRWSIDEIPNLINVVRGDMSLVGPRPASWARESYGEVFDVVFSVPPGVTGLWQVMGRSDLTFAQRIALDCEYVRRRSLLVDIWIIARTVPVVLSGRGAY